MPDGLVRNQRRGKFAGGGTKFAGGGAKFAGGGAKVTGGGAKVTGGEATAPHACWLNQYADPAEHDRSGRREPSRQLNSVKRSPGYWCRPALAGLQLTKLGQLGEPLAHIGRRCRCLR